MSIKVEGLGKFNRDLTKLGVDLDDLKDAMAKLAAMGAQAAGIHVPRKSGRLASSIRGNRAKNKAVVTAGRAKVPYAPVINYGSPKRGIVARHFMQQADRDVGPKIIPTLQADIDRLITEKGLA